MNTLYLSYDGMTDPLGQSQVLPYLCGLSVQGYRITLVSFEKKEAFAREKGLIEDICRKAGIDWRPQPYRKKPPALSTWLDLRRMQRVAARLQREKNFGLVHCRSYLPALVGLRMKRKYGLPFLFDMRGFWADERVEGELWNLRHPLYRMIYRYFKRKERQFLSEAAHTISLTEAGRREILSWDRPQRPAPMTVIPCCADLELFDPEKISPEEQSRLREELGLSANAFVLCYLGSIGTWYLLPEMLQFCKYLMDNKPEAYFLFITGGAPKHILQAARKLELPTDRILIRRAPRRQVPLYLSLADLGIFFVKPTFSKKASSPTKQGEMMGMGLPLICNEVGDSGEIVRKTEGGLVLRELSPEALQLAAAKGMDKIKSSPARIRAGALKHYSLQSGIERFEVVYRKILGS